MRSFFPYRLTYYIILNLTMAIVLPSILTEVPFKLSCQTILLNTKNKINNRFKQVLIFITFSNQISETKLRRWHKFVVFARCFPCHVGQCGFSLTQENWSKLHFDDERSHSLRYSQKKRPGPQNLRLSLFKASLNNQLFNFRHTF